MVFQINRGFFGLSPPAKPAAHVTNEQLWQKLDDLEKHLTHRLSYWEMIMALDISKLTADVTALDSAVQAAATVITALKQTNSDQATQIQTLKDALAAATSTSDPAIQAALDAIDETIAGDKTLLDNAGTAIPANTGAAPADQPAADATVAAATT